MPRRILLLLFLLLGSLASAAERVIWTAEAQGSKVVLKAKIEQKWHLYSISPTDGPVPTKLVPVAPLKPAGAVTQSKPIRKLDPNFGIEVEYFADSAEFTVPVTREAKVGDKIEATYQTCDDRTCEPPKTVRIPVGGGAVETPAIVTPRDQGLLSFVLFAFGAGLLSLLTPCVFPMVPITVSYFTKQAQAGRGGGAAMAGVFSLGIVGAFTAFGLLVTVLFGAGGIQTFATNPWVNVAMAAVFVVLALSLFGFIHVGVPSSIASRFDGTGKKGFVGPLLMGLTFTLTSFTCTSPLVGTILVSAAGGDLLYPFFGMLAFSSAFALPFFFLALFPQALAKLPRAGVWMETTKAFMGFLELAAAVKFLSNVDLVVGTNLLTRPVFLLVWIVILSAAAFYLAGILKLKSAPVPSKLGPGRSVVLGATVLSLLALGAGVLGRPLGELEAFLPPKASDWITDYDRARATASAQGKPLLINFTGVTCTNCRWMESEMFPRLEIAALLNGYVRTELFTDRAKPEDRRNGALQQKLTNSVTLPVYLVMTPEGKVTRIFPGSTRNPQEFAAFLTDKRK